MGADTAIMPKRPAPLHLDRTWAQVSRDKRTYTITATLEEGPAQSFSIEQSRDFDWFRVSPSGGVLNPGEPLSLTLTYVPREYSVQGEKGCFIIKLADGWSRPVIVMAGAEEPFIPRLQEPRIAAVIEAEDLVPADREVTRSSNASNGGAVKVGEGDQLRFDFPIERANDYYIATRCRMVGNQYRGISGTAQLDDNPDRKMRIWLARNFRCNSVFPFPDNPKKMYHAQHLEIGTHRVVFRPDGAVEVDAFYVVTSPNALYRRGYDPLPLK